MRRFSTLIWMLVILGAAFGLYLVKYQVQAIKTQVAQTARDLESEKEALHVVAAEWAYLNRPERLQALSAQYLTSSTNITADKIAEIDTLPMKKQVLASAAPEGNVHPVSVRITGAAR